MQADIEGAIAENFHPRCATKGVSFNENLPTLAAVRAAVSNQCCRISRRHIDDVSDSAACASHGGSVVYKRATAGDRSAEEPRESAARTGDRAAVVDEGAAACARI